MKAVADHIHSKSQNILMHCQARTDGTCPQGTYWGFTQLLVNVDRQNTQTEHSSNRNNDAEAIDWGAGRQQGKGVSGGERVPA